MTCRITYSTVHNHGAPQVLGSPPRKPSRWATQIRIATPAGTVLHQSNKILTNVTLVELVEVMGGLIDEIGEEIGGLATCVTWHATSSGGNKNKRRKA